MDAIKALDDQASALELVRSRAEKWAATTTALISLFGIGSVLTSIDKIPEYDERWRIGIAVFLLSGIFSLAASTYLLFPTSPVIHKVNDLSKFMEHLRNVRVNTALKELEYLEWSKGFTILGLFLISVAIALSWFAPKTESTSDSI